MKEQQNMPALALEELHAFTIKEDNITPDTRDENYTDEDIPHQSQSDQCPYLFNEGRVYQPIGITIYPCVRNQNARVENKATRNLYSDADNSLDNLDLESSYEDSEKAPTQYKPPVKPELSDGDKIPDDNLEDVLFFHDTHTKDKNKGYYKRYDIEDDQDKDETKTSSDSEDEIASLQIDSSLSISDTTNENDELERNLSGDSEGGEEDKFNDEGDESQPESTHGSVVSDSDDEHPHNVNNAYDNAVPNGFHGNALNIQNNFRMPQVNNSRDVYYPQNGHDHNYANDANYDNIDFYNNIYFYNRGFHFDHRPQYIWYSPERYVPPPPNMINFLQNDELPDPLPNGDNEPLNNGDIPAEGEDEEEEVIVDVENNDEDDHLEPEYVRIHFDPEINHQQHENIDFNLLFEMINFHDQVDDNESDEDEERNEPPMRVAELPDAFALDAEEPPDK